MLWQRVRPYVLVAPALSSLLVFFIYPIFYMSYLSLTDWDFLSPTKPFIGLGNFVDLFRDALFWQVLYNSLIYTVLSVGLNVGLAVLIALWLNRPGFWKGILQGVVFSPHIISMVSVALLWMWMMDPQYGLINSFLSGIGLPKLAWLKSPHTALLSLVLVSVWKSVGFYALIVLAGLQSIPKEVYEAANLDNAPGWRAFTKITVPMLSPTLFFLTVIGLINSFQVFDTISVMTGGGPINSTNTLVYFIYQNGFVFFKIGYASAAGVLMMAIVAALTFFHFKVLEKRVHYR